MQIRDIKIKNVNLHVVVQRTYEKSSKTQIL
jgi:hypothetical protein